MIFRLKSSTKNLFVLVAPHVRPRLGLIFLAVVLGVIGAVAPTSILFLFDPLWRLVLFVGEDVQLDGAAPPTQDFVLGFFEGMRDRFLTPDATGEGQLTDEARLTMLALVVTVALTLAIIGAAAQYGFIWLTRFVSMRMMVDLRLRMARHLMGLSMRYHLQRHFGDLLSRISADVGMTTNAVQTGLRDLVQIPAYMIAAMSIAIHAAPKMTVYLLFGLPVLALPIAIFAKKVRKGSKKSLTSLGSSVQVLSQMFQGVRTVKAYRQEEKELERFSQVNEDYLKQSMRMVRAIALSRSWALVLGHGGVALLLLPVGYFAIKGELFTEPSKMLMFFMAMAQLNSHVKRLAKAVTTIQESVGASDRLQELLDERVDLAEAENPKEPTDLVDEIRFNDVTFCYRDDDTPAVKGLNLSVKRGETLAIVGPSGAGKSTIADLVCRFVDPTEGALLIDGVDLREISLEAWCRLFGHVDQTPFLFHASIEENIRYGNPSASDEEVEQAARAANIHDFIMSLQDGYATDVADAGSRLSGGQRQRLVIARALLKNAPILILDEATSALDTEAESAVQAALDRLVQNRTVIVIAHRLSTIRHADRIAVLKDGSLVELGTHEELIEKNGTYSRLYELAHARDSNAGELEADQGDD